MHYLGFDIGGSFIKAVLVKEKNIIKALKKNLPDNFTGLVDLISETALELKEGLVDNEIGGFGFGFAGALDKNREIMLNSPNISYLDSQPLKKTLEEKLKPLAIKIEHDAHCFLIAEKEVGLAKDLNHVLLLTLGTGIGSAIMINGQIFFGAHGGGGDAGHMVLDLSQNLEFEDLAANKFLKRILGIGSIESAKRAREGDQKAIEVLAQLGKNLGIGLGGILNIFDAEAVILAGGLTETKEFILEGIKSGIEKIVISSEAQKTQILFSELGAFGGALGAALLFYPSLT